MLRHILIITFRGFKRNQATFLINLIGLSTGLSCVLLIYLWVSDEFRMDSFHQKDELLYQAMMNYHYPEGIRTMDITSVLLGQALKHEFPEVKEATLIYDDNLPNGKLTYDKHSVGIRRLFTDKHFFELFSYDLILGDKAQVLQEKNSLLISEKIAEKLFPSIDQSIGKFVQLSNQYWSGEYQITGIFKDPPAYSTKQFDVVVPYHVFVEQDSNTTSWLQHRVETYVELHKETDLRLFNQKIKSFLPTRDERSKELDLFLQPYDERYLYNVYENGQQVGGRIDYVKFFILIAAFILLIACINFINLSTAHAFQKMKQIGIKKTIGASRKELIIQFMSESICMVFISLIVAVAVVHLLLPHFNALTGKQLESNLDVNFMLALLAISICTGILAGAYPAFYLSKFKPVSVLKEKSVKKGGEISLRKGLLVFQFILSVSFILSVWAVEQQLAYTQEKQVGFNRNNVISFQRPRNHDDVEAFLTELKRLSGVENASNMRGNILSGRYLQSGFSWRGQDADKEWNFKSPQIGYELIETLGMKILAGRSFSKEMGDDASKIVINESAMRLMQLEDPIGRFLEYGDEEEKQIIGVVEDFHYGSFHELIKPLIFDFKSFGRDFLVKIVPGTEIETIEQIEKIYKKFHPEYAFDFRFLEEENQRLYKSEKRVSIISQYFAILAIIISCLGLLGLSIFTTEQRRKEIGIRKILGASVINIVHLLTKDFSKLVLLGAIIALPISNYLIQKWLNNFAYRIELSIWAFIIPPLLVLILAWLIVGVYTFRAAKLNPAHNLRDE